LEDSVFVITVLFFKCRLRFLFLHVNRWPEKGFLAFALPFFVIVKRFFTDFLVFNFGTIISFI